MSPVPPGPVPRQGHGCVNNSDSNPNLSLMSPNLPPPSYEEFLRIAQASSADEPWRLPRLLQQQPEAAAEGRRGDGGQEGGGGADAGAGERPVPAELTAAASAIVAQAAASGGSSGGGFGPYLYPTLAGSAAIDACHDGNAGAMTSDGSMSSIGSDSCGRPHSGAADAACTTTSSSRARPSVVGADDTRPGARRSAAAGWTAAAYAYASPLACKSGPRRNLGATSSGSGDKSKKSREGGLLVVRPAEPYVRPPPQPLLRPGASAAGISTTTTVTASYNGVGVSPNTSLYTSITTLDDPFGNAKRRRAASLMTAATSRSTSSTACAGTCTLQPSAYETTHPRGRLSIADTRHLLLDTSSDEADEADDEWDSSSHHHGRTSSST